MESFSKSSKKLTQKTGRLVKDLKRQADAYKTAVETQNKKIVDLDKRIDQQNEIICQQNARLAEQEEKLAEMSRRLIENTNQLTDLSKEKLVLSASPKVLIQGSERPAATAAASGSCRSGEPAAVVPEPVGAKRKRPSDTEERIESLFYEQFFSWLWIRIDSIRIQHFSSIRLRIQAKTELSKTISFSNFFEIKI
jgi:septal ring factor EnvC (AmiA/AmiB activator)